MKIPKLTQNDIIWIEGLIGRKLSKNDIEAIETIAPLYDPRLMERPHSVRSTVMVMKWDGEM